MDRQTISQVHKKTGHRAQAMVEFAIALPVLVVLLVGIMEAGRLILTYALANNASRDAVRYASAVGRGEDGFLKYNNCLGIKKAAQQSAFIVPIQLTDITITVTDENNANPKVCDKTTIGEDTDISVKSGYRVNVTVLASYKPVIKLIPIGEKNFTATSTRTILGIFELPNP